MKSMYQLDREMTTAWLAWGKAQETADRAKSEYNKLYSDWKKRLAQDEQKEAAAQAKKARRAETE